MLIEYQTLIKSPTLWQGIKPLLVIYSIPSIGVLFSELFGPFYGTLVAVLWLITLFVLFALSRELPVGILRTILQIVTIIWFAVATFAISPFHYCSVEESWFILGKNATQINQVDDTMTLCHYNNGAEYDTVCHSFTDGYHGILSTPLD